MKKLVVEHRADDRVTFEVFLPIMQVKAHFIVVLFWIKRTHLFMYSRPKPICLFKAICSRRSTDTSDDFIEGLRHFDKVIVSIKHFT